MAIQVVIIQVFAESVKCGDMRWENWLTYKKYGKNPDSQRNIWFKPRIIYELCNNGILTRKQIFDCFASDITSHALLKKKMIDRNPSKKTYIEAKFKEYGF